MSKWTISKNRNGQAVVQVSCDRCGRKCSSALLEHFQHGGPCSVRVELPPEFVREAYAEIKEAGRERVPKPMTRFERNDNELRLRGL